MSTLAVPLQADFILLLMLILRKMIGVKIIIIMIIMYFIIYNLFLLITEQMMSTGRVAGTVEHTVGIEFYVSTLKGKDDH
jgi:hypothetical protein